MDVLSQTSTTHGARDHARAQANSMVRGMPIVPASSTADPPAGVDPAAVIWEETIEAGEYAAHRLPAGALLRLLDVDGDACAHLLVHNARHPSERLNLADTVKVQWQAYPTRGSALLSDMGRSLLTIAEDTSGRHDALCGGPAAARDHLITALAKAGLERRDVGPSLAFFKGVVVQTDGTLAPELAPSAPGRSVLLHCDLDVHVAIAAEPHVLDRRPEPACGPVRITAWHPRAPLTIAPPTPELARAYANSADYRASL
jgi:uncharacterized protein YcgI (DUF1989 family)